MSNGYMPSFRTFTLESLVALRRWSAEQRSSKKRPNAPKTQRNAAHTPTDERIEVAKVTE